jgi:hypothetical protein
MQALSKMLAFLLLSPLLAAPMVAQGLRPDLASDARPAGCHEDHGNVPAPAPASHSCCLASHHPAILQHSSTWRPSLEVSAKVESYPDVALAAALNPLPSLMVAFGGPPLMSPLRV